VTTGKRVPAPDDAQMTEVSATFGDSNKHLLATGPSGSKRLGTVTENSDSRDRLVELLKATAELQQQPVTAFLGGDKGANIIISNR